MNEELKAIAVEAGAPQMKQWHFDNCKGKKEPKKITCEKCNKNILISAKDKHEEKCKGIIIKV